MKFDSLCREILDISQQVENLIDKQDEANCTVLLRQRQTLLEELQEHVHLYKNTSEFDEYQTRFRQFLTSIQLRDQHYVAKLRDQSQEILSKGSKQAKNKKAIKAYRNIL